MAEAPDPLESLFANARLAALVTLKRDGRPQISNIAYHYNPSDRTFAVSVTDARAKTVNMRRDNRVSLYVSANEGWAYAVAEGNAGLSSVAAEPHDDTVERLVELYRAIRGDHPDWDEFRVAMVAERRLVLRVRADRFYGRAG